MQTSGGCQRIIPSVKTIGTQLVRIYTDKANGIKLPPEPTTCCMSGCANCVWIEYAREISKLFDDNDDKIREIILNKISDSNLRAFLSMELRLGKHKQCEDNKKNGEC